MATSRQSAQLLRTALVRSARPCVANTASHANCLRSTTTTPAFQTRLAVRPATHPRFRLYSSSSSTASDEEYHETSARGTKLWTFDQLERAVDSNKSDIIIVDTREPGEVRQTGHIPGAINIPITTHPESFHVTAEEFEDRFGFERPAKNSELVFYCKAGVRSRAAAALAAEAGWTGVGEYPGSWLDWEKNGGRAQKPRDPIDALRGHCRHDGQVYEASITQFTQDL
ncbi:Thiosulfate sulfurtransferase RDL2 like protein [Verticillium longisporum]|nr:Thiosulfate sulfurtransferase RDL2 like protein [Verticillium longisporum]